MATIIPATDILGEDDGLAYVSSDEKTQLYEKQIPFYIVGAIAEEDGQFGPRTVFTIRRKGMEDARLTFGASERRKQRAQKISQHLANGADYIGPFYLTRWENGTKWGWELTAEPTQAKSIPAPNPAQRDAEKREMTTAGDDLPF